MKTTQNHFRSFGLIFFFFMAFNLCVLPKALCQPWNADEQAVIDRLMAADFAPDKAQELTELIVEAENLQNRMDQKEFAKVKNLSKILDIYAQFEDCKKRNKNNDFLLDSLLGMPWNESVDQCPNLRGDSGPMLQKDFVAAFGAVVKAGDPNEQEKVLQQELLKDVVDKKKEFLKSLDVSDPVAIEDVMVKFNDSVKPINASMERFEELFKLKPPYTPVDLKGIDGVVSEMDKVLKRDKFAKLGGGLKDAKKIYEDIYKAIAEIYCNNDDIKGKLNDPANASVHKDLGLEISKKAYEFFEKEMLRAAYEDYTLKFNQLKFSKEGMFLKGNQAFREHFGQLQSRKDIQDKFKQLSGGIVQPFRHQKLSFNSTHMKFIKQGYENIKQLYEKREKELKDESLFDTSRWRTSKADQAAWAGALRDMILYHPTKVGAYLLKNPSFAGRLCDKLAEFVDDKQPDVEDRRISNEKLGLGVSTLDTTVKVGKEVAELVEEGASEGLSVIPIIGLGIDGGKTAYNKKMYENHVEYMKKISDGMYMDLSVASDDRIKQNIKHQRAMHDYGNGVDDGMMNLAFQALGGKLVLTSYRFVNNNAKGAYGATSQFFKDKVSIFKSDALKNVGAKASSELDPTLGSVAKSGMSLDALSSSLEQQEFKKKKKQLKDAGVKLEMRDATDFYCE